MTELSESRIGIFGSFPPEHTAHIINTAFLTRALLQMEFNEVVGITDNELRPEELPFDARLDEYGADHILRPLNFPSIAVYNLHHLVEGGFGLDKKRTKKVIEKAALDTVLMTYYPLFGQPFIEALKEIRKRIVLFVKVGLVIDSSQSIFSEYHRGYPEALEAVDQILVAQENDRELIHDRYKIPEGKINVVPKIVDSELLASVPHNAMPVARKYGLEGLFRSQKNIVGYFGRIDLEKNVDDLINKIWPKVKRRAKNAHLLIMGHGDQVRFLKHSCEDHTDITMREVNLPNFELLCLLSLIDVLAFPSGSDYTPRIPMEALLVGTNVVLNDLNFNQIYKPYSCVVPVEGFDCYSPQGYNDNARFASGISKTKLYARPDSDLFAESIVNTLRDKRGPKLPQGLFTTEDFIDKFRNALENIKNT